MTDADPKSRLTAVLAHLTPQTDTDAPSSVPVGARFMEHAHDIRRRIAAEDREYDRLVHALITPIRDRLRRFPQRSLRPQTLLDLVQRWRFMACRDWRLDLDAELDKARVSLIEHRLVAGVMRKKGDPAWVGIEEDLAVIRVELLVNRSSAHLESHCVATFSQHAIARRLQRHPDGSIESLMHDNINLLAVAVSGEPLDRRGRRRLARQSDQPDRRGERHP